ncbi:MFS transporter [Nocardioides sp. Kera G14]|uniref:MFS transporter n=1 Tax=Nocardioides sp. Kera G14 TaxID=2884264 RepID=UPI001D108E40|nr:MFS transporter [Nocardioides sp. Kera G14]UDY24715.1 MFS transporter [Nocardioides sp. Kera G14]
MRAYARTTVGVFCLAFLFAFEALAVATVMPDVAADLDGLSLYAVAFAAPMAGQVLALTVAGPWIDRRGPGPAIALGVAVFATGCLLCGAAPTMMIFLGGRLLQGLGAGAYSVGLYVVVAQAYPEELRPRAFTVLSAAWILPALVGPVLAATVADVAGWRWVFLGIPVLALVAWLLVRAAATGGGSGHAPFSLDTFHSAAGAALGVLLVSVAGQVDVVIRVPLLTVGVACAVLAGRSLLPARTWSGGRGLPSIIGTRGLIGAAFAGAEAYIPLLLHLDRGLSLSHAGWALTAGAVTWFLGSWLAGRRLGILGDPVVGVRLGVAALAVGVLGFALVAVDAVPLAIPIGSWGVAGLGIGMAFSTLGVLTLEAAPESEHGRASSALQLNDALVQALVLALGSAVFAAYAASHPVHGAVVLVVAAGALAAAASWPALRLRQPGPTADSL